MPSTDKINYSIRLNKSIERNIIFDILHHSSKIFNLQNYRYIGLGSLWFVDFMLAHKQLAIDSMISIEEDSYNAVRAEFNKPYACIDVKKGESTLVLRDIPLEERKLLVWLDYDSSLNGPVLKDLAILCERAPAGSILITSINAHKSSLPNVDETGKEFGTDLDRMRYYAGDLIPSELPRRSMQTSGYPAFLSKILFTQIQHQITANGRTDIKIFPFLNMYYKDDAPMITIGAALLENSADSALAEKLKSIRIFEQMDADHQMAITAPPLTLKEKAALDQLMPSATPPSEKDIEALGFKMKPSHTNSYHKFYLYYPTYAELFS